VLVLREVVLAEAMSAIWTTSESLFVTFMAATSSTNIMLSPFFFKSVFHDALIIPLKQGLDPLGEGVSRVLRGGSP